MTRDEVIQAVGDKLKAVTQNHPKLLFDVIGEGVRQEGEWWTVPVISWTANNVEPPNAFLVNVFANIEESLYEEQQLNILFIPTAA